MSVAPRHVFVAAVLLNIATMPVAFANGGVLGPNNEGKPTGACESAGFVGTCEPKASQTTEDQLGLLQKNIHFKPDDSSVPEPEPEQDSPAPSAAGGDEALSLDQISEKALEHVLKMAGEGGDAQASRVEKIIEEDDAAGRSTSPDVTANREIIRKAIEKEEMSMDVEEAVKKDALVTTKMLEEIYGQGDTLETGPEALSFQGDMLANPSDMAALVEAARSGQRTWLNLWPKGEPIKFCFASDIASSAKQVFLDAVQHYQDLVPCLEFTQIGHKSGASDDPDNTKRCDQKNAIFVQSSENSGCNSYVGMQTWTDITRLQLRPGGCDTLGTAAHELGHAIGMSHEQARPDRDSFVAVLWGNIKPGKGHNFNRRTSSQIGEAKPTEQAYDYLSLMHYGDDAFGVKGTDGKKKKTLEAVAHLGAPNTDLHMGNRFGLTQADVQQVASMYGCPAKEGKFKVCTGSPKDCTAEACTCHEKINKGTVVKVKRAKKGAKSCWACEKACTTPNSWASWAHYPCGCGAGKVKVIQKHSSGNEIAFCKDGPPLPPPTPPTTPPPTPSPPPPTPTPPTPPPGIILPTCEGDSATFDAGYGGCKTYAKNNKQFCVSDKDKKSGALAENVCNECGKCQVKPTTPACEGSSATFDAGYGGCKTYAKSNKNFCGSDKDKKSGALAEKVCPECGKCA